MSTSSPRAELIGPPAPPARHATLVAALQAAAQGRSGLTFIDLREQETFFSFAEVLERAARVAAGLGELGVRPGERVALVLPTGPDFMDAFFGALCAGAVPVPLYPPVRLGRLEEFHARTARMLEVCGARVLLSDARVSRLLGVAVARARVPLGCRQVADLRARGAGGHVHAGAGSELALIQFSSGTTVDPKPVALTHRAVLANAEAIDTFLPEGGPHPQQGVTWLPLYHDMGLIGCLVLSVAHPGPLALLGPELFLARPALWLRAISRHRATVSPAPNFAYGLCLKRVQDEELEGCDLSSWQLALNGAEPVSAEVLRRFAGRFARFGLDPRALTPVYGLSEASLAVTFTPRGRGARFTPIEGGPLRSRGEARLCADVSEMFDNTETIETTGTTESAGSPAPGPERRELASLGLPLPGVSVRVAASLSDPAPLAEGRVGRLLVAGPSIMSGYFGNPEATARALQGGWLDTGDLGFVLGGELHLCGRAKEVVILRGQNHAPQEFEDALEGLAGVRTGCAAAVGFVPQGGEGEELLLLVERAGEEVPQADGAGHALDEQIRGRVVERTGVRPHTVLLLAPGTLPRTSSGKLRRGEALRQLQAGELRAPDRVTVLRIAAAAARSMAAMAGHRLRGALGGDEPGR